MTTTPYEQRWIDRGSDRIGFWRVYQDARAVFVVLPMTQRDQYTPAPTVDHLVGKLSAAQCSVRTMTARTTTSPGRAHQARSPITWPPSLTADTAQAWTRAA